jgi:hypothetical protein
MKSKIVLWGANAQDEKILIAVALRADDNKVDIWTFPESVATEDFYQQMMKEWRDGAGMTFPDPHTHIERELAVAESLLPDDIKVERTDVVQRAQAEWHFIVLSAKLHKAYEDQLGELKDRVEKLEKFDDGVWDSLKEFWDKLQNQVKERNLFREHADLLRDNANSLFGKMKELRSKMDLEFERISRDTHDGFIHAFEEIEKKMSEGARLPALFEELKRLQKKYTESSMTRDHRAKVWDKLNDTFKAVKERRFGGKPEEGGGSAGGDSAYIRTKRRFEGLVEAINRMEESIRRDKKDLEFQNHKIATTDGQLEAQIRQAKIVMIDERIRSKEEKLVEMKNTMEDLEQRLASMKERETRHAAKAAAKEKFAEKVKADAEAREEAIAKLDKEESGDKKPESLLGAISATLGESLEDMMDTAKAVASVVSEKIEDAIENLKEDLTTEKPAEPEAPAAEKASAPEPAEEPSTETAEEPVLVEAGEEVVAAAEAVADEKPAE